MHVNSLLKKRGCNCMPRAAVCFTIKIYINRK